MNDLDVREIREKSGLTQEELAERMGMYKENMYQIGTYQSGQIRPRCIRLYQRYNFESKSQLFRFGDSYVVSFLVLRLFVVVYVFTS